ncbi:MAG: methyltransferase domain-containing protein [Dehalococcoidia bacterium]|nr:methyltransferase domain-containing protein [Dehalococcoidia bacterium]
MRDPNQYAVFADERSRPFFSLLERVPERPFREIIDLGCGAGVLTRSLAERWPQAHVIGLDNSPQMLAAGAKHAIPGRFDLVEGDILAYDKPTDLIFTNAALQWVDGHETLFPRLAGLIKSGGVLACQMPSSFQQPSHLIMEEVARSGPWAPKLADWRQLQVKELEWYGNLLLEMGFSVDAWQTTYHFLLQGDDPVVEWVKGTSLQPILNRLDEAERAAYLAEYAHRLREVYPSQAHGTVYPFTRIFFVASRVD